MISLEEVCERAVELPCSPGLLPKAVELLQSPDAQLEDLEKLIQMDTGLSAAVLKYANSPAFSSGRTFDSISEAVLRLGFREIYRIVVAVLGGKWASADANVHAFDWSPGDFCRHSFTVAVAARHLSFAVDPEMADIAYTAGLFHDVGKLALGFFATEELQRVRSYQAEYECIWSEAELAILGYTHLQVSEQLMRQWSFPPNLLDVALHYEFPEKAQLQFRNLVSYIHLAKQIAVQTGIGGGEDAFWLNASAEVAEQMGISEAAMRDVIPALIADLRRLLGGRLVAGAIQL